MRIKLGGVLRDKGLVGEGLRAPVNGEPGDDAVGRDVGQVPLECDQVGLHIYRLKAGQRAWHSLLGGEEGADLAGALAGGPGEGAGDLDQPGVIQVSPQDKEAIERVRKF